MIVRIASEGQYELGEDERHKLHELDLEAVDAVDAGDEKLFRERWRQMLELIDRNGKRLGEDELVGSEVILPPRDVSFDEARREFSGEGLIPD